MRKLFDAGMRVFAERGYHAARVDDIVRAARTSHGTFYLYFANKEEIFAAVGRDPGCGQKSTLRARERRGGLSTHDSLGWRVQPAG